MIDSDLVRPYRLYKGENISNVVSTFPLCAIPCWILESTAFNTLFFHLFIYLHIYSSIHLCIYISIYSILHEILLNKRGYLDTMFASLFHQFS